MPTTHAAVALPLILAAASLAGCSHGGDDVGLAGGGHATVGPATLSDQIVTLTPGFPGSARTSGVATIDVDNDADLDVFFGTSLYLNFGGSFEAAPAGSLPGSAPLAASGDLDGDGDVDLIAGGQLWLNDGSGRFTDATANRLPSGIGYVQLADLDGDGDLDAVAITRVFLNNGFAVFTESTTAWVPANAPPCGLLADLDGDGDPDWLGTRLLRNNGQTFVQDPTPVPFPGTAFAVGDLDGDGDLDIAGSNFLQGSGPWNVLLLNDGLGHFVDRSSQLPQGSNTDEFADVEIGDVDGDGDRDVVIATQGKLLLNDGTAHFTESPAGLLPLYCQQQIALADLDGDGDLDLVTASGQNFDCLLALPNLLLLNDGQGRFRRPGDERRYPHGGVLVDVDGDADVDAVGWSGSTTTLERNDGTGHFTLVPDAFVPPAVATPRAVGDLDGNGSLDLIFGGTDLLVYANDGSGRFTATTAIATGTVTAAALADIDGDLDLDLVVGRGVPPATGAQTLLLLNDGRGGFTDATATRMPVDADYTADVAFGDFDRDGDPDLVLASGNGMRGDGRIRLYLNAGAGRFVDATGSRLPGTRFSASGVTLVDLEADGDLDILIDAYSGPCWYRNDGSGSFDDASASLPFCGRDHRFDAANDLDGNGDVDLAINSFGVSFFLQDAPAVFREDPRSHLPVLASPLTFPSVHAVDFDGDGDLEWSGTVNLARHLFAPGAATVGRRWRVQVFARPGWLATTHLAQVHFGFTLATPPIAIPPFGHLGLDPATSTMTTVTVPAPAGRTALEFALPANPALVGQPVHAQALILDASGAVGGFSNRISATIGS
ncbi:MAG: VCBS repeat-containing protein [Planctomycetes bacterium]|nr:VCBS repeat-containing protein [Planctomycetota bacterium]